MLLYIATVIHVFTLYDKVVYNNIITLMIQIKVRENWKHSQELISRQLN